MPPSSSSFIISFPRKPSLAVSEKSTSFGRRIQTRRSSRVFSSFRTETLSRTLSSLAFGPHKTLRAPSRRASVLRQFYYYETTTTTTTNDNNKSVVVLLLLLGCFFVVATSSCFSESSSSSSTHQSFVSIKKGHHSTLIFLNQIVFYTTHARMFRRE